MEKGGVGLLFSEMIDPAEPTMCWQGSPTTATLAVEEAAAQYGSTIRNFVWHEIKQP